MGRGFKQPRQFSNRSEQVIRCTIGEVGVAERAGSDEGAGRAEAHGGEDVVAVGVTNHDNARWW